MNSARIRALVSKELLELRHNLIAVVPVIVVMATSLVLPFLITEGIPFLTGERLSDDRGFREAVRMAAGYVPIMRDLPAEAAVQSFLYQQFLIFFVLIPVAGAMSIAAYSVIGEKQGRTLEPLLATPISTVELLAAKLLGAALPSLALEALALGIYFGAIAYFAEPGVVGALLSIRTLLIATFLGPLASLVALQLAVLVSSRVNDARSAQQIGVLVILPVVAIVVAQFSGSFWLTVPLILLIGLGLLLAWLLLLLLSVALFQRETILTRWK